MVRKYIIRSTELYLTHSFKCRRDYNVSLHKQFLVNLLPERLRSSHRPVKELDICKQLRDAEKQNLFS